MIVVRKEMIMCLKIDNDKYTWEFLARLTKAGKRGILAFKSYRQDNGALFSRNYPKGPIKPGWVVSDRVSKRLSWSEKLTGIVMHGIHVYASRVSSSYYYTSDTQVRVFKRDFVAVGISQAVFMKVFLTKKEHDRTIDYRIGYD